MKNQKALNQYKQVDTQTKVESADPHQIITLLMQGAIDRIGQCKGYIQQKDFAKKGIAINKAVDIINGLRASLNHESGEELSQQLEQLYEFMVGHLYKANRENSIPILEEVEALIKTIKSGWDEIPLSVRQEYANEKMDT